MTRLLSAEKVLALAYEAEHAAWVVQQAANQSLGAARNLVTRAERAVEEAKVPT